MRHQNPCQWHKEFKILCKTHNDSRVETRPIRLRTHMEPLWACTRKLAEKIRPASHDHIGTIRFFAC